MVKQNGATIKKCFTTVGKRNGLTAYSEAVNTFLFTVAKVGVASSSLVFRSTKTPAHPGPAFLFVGPATFWASKRAPNLIFFVSATFLALKCAPKFD